MNSRQDFLQVKRSVGSCQSKFKMHTKVSESSVNVPKISGKLQPHQDELHQLGELAGIHMDATVFRILVEFLNMGVDPNTIFSVLKSIKRQPSRHSRSSISSHASRVSHT